MLIHCSFTTANKLVLSYTDKEIDSSLLWTYVFLSIHIVLILMIYLIKNSIFVSDKMNKLITEHLAFTFVFNKNCGLVTLGSLYCL